MNQNCFMPKRSWEWNDDEGNSCAYCNPTQKQEVVFPDDMLNDNGDSGVSGLVETIKKQKTGKHDCLISLTGGRDSSYALYYAKEILGLNPIAFNFDTGFVTDIARENMRSITDSLGVDFIQYSVDGRFLKKLARGFFINHGEVCSVCHQGYFYAVQKVVAWTGLRYVIRGLCKKTEANRAKVNYIDWYCLSDESFQAKVKNFMESEDISETELKRNHDFMHLREWFDPEIKRIDLPDMLDYGHETIERVLKKVNWKRGKYYIHSDCNFIPILVCAQKVKDGYSKKHINVSNLVIDGEEKETLKTILLQEENIDFDSISDERAFLQHRLDINDNEFESSLIKNWL
ncbi:MAG: hypothetical protein GY710_15480 [Desulfobacteraceae bacterium]|nr:hypothetical protein [Desulfobacteraceae bacterium]